MTRPSFSRRPPVCTTTVPNTPSFPWCARRHRPRHARATRRLVTGNGAIHGWIGGGCAQPAVIKTVRLALADGKARMIRIAADAGSEREIGDVLEFGWLAIPAEPSSYSSIRFCPVLALVIFGSSLVAVTLGQLAPRVGFAVSVVAPGVSTADFPMRNACSIRTMRSRSLRKWPGVPTSSSPRRGGEICKRCARPWRSGPVTSRSVASRRKATVLKESLRAAGADLAAVEKQSSHPGLPDRRFDTGGGRAVGASRRGRAAPRDTPLAAQQAQASCCHSAAVKVQPATAVAAEATSASSCCGA